MAVKFDKMLAKLRESDEGVAENGLPAGGTTGQILYKQSDADNDAGWKDESGSLSSQFLVVWFEAVASGTGGTLSAPTGGTLVADQWPDGVDALATTLDASGRPAWETPRTAAGSLVTATLDVATGEWGLSGTPAEYPVGIVFAYTIGVASYDPDYALVGPDYQGDEPMTELSTPADTDKAVFWQGGVLKYRLWSSIASYMAGLITTHETSHAPADAEANVNADWEAESGDAAILNKPTLGTAAALDVPAAGNAASGQVVKGSDTRLSDARTPSAHAASHADGTDDIQSATNAQKGLATAAQITALEAATAAQHTQDTDQKLDSGGVNEVTAANLKTLVSAYVKNNLTATAAPTVDDDSADGYSVGSTWLDTTNKKMYVCMDPSAGAADWDELTASAGGGSLGGTTSTVDNAVLRADGTGGATLQASDLAIADGEAGTQANVGLVNVHAGQTNSSLRLEPKGTGALIFGPAPDGTATGGNARGESALDLQGVRSNASEVASGKLSAIVGGSRHTVSGENAGAFAGVVNYVTGLRAVALGGLSNTVSGAAAAAIAAGNGQATAKYSLIHGEGTHATADYSESVGLETIASLYGQRAAANGKFSARGDAQDHALIARIATASTDAATAWLNGSSSRLVLTAERTWLATVKITARQDDGKSGGAIYAVMIERTGTTTRIVGSVATLVAWFADAELGTPTIALTADDTNEALQITITPANATATRWLAALSTAEVGY